jgi:hypothetical protein
MELNNTIMVLLFFDIKIFKNKKKKVSFINSLEDQGYKYGDYNTLTKQTAQAA